MTSLLPCIQGIFACHKVENFKMGELVFFASVIFCDLKSFLQQKIPDIISSYLIFCDVNIFAKQAKIRSSQKYHTQGMYIYIVLHNALTLLYYFQIILELSLYLPSNSMISILSPSVLRPTNFIPASSNFCINLGFTY